MMVLTPPAAMNASGPLEYRSTLPTILSVTYTTLPAATTGFRVIEVQVHAHPVLVSAWVNITASGTGNHSRSCTYTTRDTFMPPGGATNTSSAVVTHAPDVVYTTTPGGGSASVSHPRTFASIATGSGTLFVYTARV
jgi:hypothetical protein